MANKRTKERHENNWVDDIDKLEIQSKKMRENASKGKSYHGKQHQESQVKKNRLSNAPKAKAKWSQVENEKTGAKAKEKWIIENEKIGGKTPASGRTTWNSRCGTDIGVFDQVTNNRGKKTRNSTATAMTDDSSKRNNRNNVETNGQTTSNTYSSMEQETVVMNIKQENPTDDQDEEIHIIEEKVVKTPATVMKIKQEKQSYQPKVLITLINENNEKINQALVQPTRELSGNEQICASKETLISTRTDKYPAGASAFPSITRLPQSPGPNKTSHSLDFNQSGLTITPVGPSAANSFSTSSEAAETTRRIHYGATRSRGSSPDSNGSGDINGTTPSQNTSPVNNELSQNGTTPVVRLATKSFSASSEDGETTRYIHYGATISQRNSPANDRSQDHTGRAQDGATISSGDITGCSQDGATISSGDITGCSQDGATISSGDITGCSQDRATISQRNTQANDRSEDNTGHTQDAAAVSLSQSPISNSGGDITGGTQDGQSQDGATASQSNSLVNNRTGDDTGRSPDGVTASQSNSLVNNRSLDVSGRSQDGATASQSNSLVNNRTGDDTGRSPDGVTASQNNFQVNNRRDDTGRSQVGATASHGNSLCNERRDIAERVNNEATNHSTRSHGNLTINIGGGDLTVNNGGLTAQMKINDVSVTGSADDVTNFVVEATRAVRDLVN